MPLILVVEGNLASQILVRTLLESAGYEVEVAGSAAQALELLSSILPALILTDVQLPGKDGLSLTRQLKSGPRTALIPVVAVSAHTKLGHRDAALAAGCAGFISKPIDVRTFSSRVAGFIPGPSFRRD